jgi:hypothetical protein
MTLVWTAECVLQAVSKEVANKYKIRKVQSNLLCEGGWLHIAVHQYSEGISFIRHLTLARNKNLVYKQHSKNYRAYDLNFNTCICSVWCDFSYFVFGITYDGNSACLRCEAYLCVCVGGGGISASRF